MSSYINVHAAHSFIPIAETRSLENDTRTSSVGRIEISVISNMEGARKALESADQDTLVIFDIDRTLVIMGDQLLYSGKSGLKTSLRNFSAYNTLNAEEKNILLTEVIKATSHEIIEPVAVEWIHDLQRRQIKTIACTTLETGRFGSIECMEQWRVDSLKELGLSFKPAFPELEDFSFNPELPNSPVFKEGALIASKRTKGEVIKAFLERSEWKPKKMIVFDDQASTFTSIEQEFQGSPVEITGFHYTYVKETLLRDQVVNRAMVDFQLQYLLEHKIWLRDDEVLKML